MAGKSHVDANYRFIAAYQEVNTRIAQRQHALTLFVTLTVSLLAALVALRSGNGPDRLPVAWLVLGFPLASICLALLNFKAERTLSNLRNFLSTLERLDNVHHDLPSYNTDPRWAAGANQARRFQDYAAAMLAVGANAIGLATVCRIYPESIAETPALLGLAVAGAVFSILALLAIPRLSYQPLPPSE